MSALVSAMLMEVDDGRYIEVSRYETRGVDPILTGLQRQPPSLLRLTRRTNSNALRFMFRSTCSQTLGRFPTCQ